MRNLGSVFLALLAAFTVSVGVAWPHPGRLDAQGCHRVLKDFHYVSGKVARKGTVHCHRHFAWSPADKQGLKLDGREVLMPADMQDVNADPPAQSECIRRGGKGKTGLCP